MKRKFNLKGILQRYGEKYSDILGIKLKSKKDSELFKWFIASILFGARITETIVLNTYKEFARRGLLSFERMKRANWNELVGALDAGGYVRYDFSTADDLISCMKLLGDKYRGSLNRLHKLAKDSKDLEKRLQEFRGIGPTTTTIFLRDLRGVWKKANPSLGHLATAAAKELGIRNAKEFWTEHRIPGYDFVNFETALMRLGREARRKRCKVGHLFGSSFI
ncbi:MAG: hypothetical protein QW590_00850 [Candidatus Bilamarchaeaceae archaeon]